MYFLPLWCQTIYGWRGLWRGRSSPPGTNKPCPAALFLFLFSFICCQHRPCNHHLYNQQPCSYHPCNQQPCNHYLCKHNFMIIPLGIIILASILFTIITFKAFMASSSVRSSPAKMILIRSLQATPNADRKMWIAALPCIVWLLIIVILIIDDNDYNSILSCIIRLLITLNLFIF